MTNWVNHKLLCFSFYFGVILSLGCRIDFNSQSVTEGQLDMTQNAILEVVYRFTDASVPPEHHRSYVITVKPGRVKVVVDSYGDILVDKVHKITNEQFENVLYSLDRNQIRNARLKEDKGCTGGTSETISFSDRENEIFSGTVYHCGGEDTGDLEGDVRCFAQDIRSLVPNFEDLLQ